MPRIAYTVPGAVCTAMTPLPAYDGRGCGPWANSDAVSGQPGTQAVPVGTPDFGDAGLTVNGHSVRGGGGGYAQGSGTMRSKAWYPSQYFLRRLCGATFTVPGQGLAVWSDNQMPVPAAMPAGTAAVLAKPATRLGQRQVAQPPGPKAPARWANWLPGSGFGS